MTKYKRQHYVSRMHSKRFSDNIEKLFCSQRTWNDSRTEYASHGDIFHENYIYSSIDPANNKDPALENAFANLESETAKIFDKITADLIRKSTATLSPQECELVKSFIFHQWRRVPDFYEPLYSSYTEDEIINAIEHDLLLNDILLTEEEKKKLLEPGHIKNLIHNAKIFHLSQEPEESFNIFQKMSLVFAKINRNHQSFIIGSFPVVKLTSKDNPRLDHFETEIWMPISRDIVVGIIHSKTSHAFIAHPKLVKVVNKSIAQQSSMIASHSKELILSLKTAQKNVFKYPFRFFDATHEL